MRWCSVFIAMCVLLTCVGCGEQEVSVHGTVTLNGEPVKKGAISFRPADGKGPSFGGMIADGEYDVVDAVPGSKVAVISAIDEGKVIHSREEAMKMVEQAKAEGKRPFEAFQVDLIPANAAGNSQTVEIKPGQQTLDFAIST